MLQNKFGNYSLLLYLFPDVNYEDDIKSAHYQNLASQIPLVRSHAVYSM